MNRPVADWTHDDLLALIRDQVQESLTLDYKSAASLNKSDQKKINELSKDVAAFANSAGGRIIYGIVEDKQKKLPVSTDGVVDPVITREWIEQKLQSTIRPKVQGIIIVPIAVPTGGWAFVIDIPAATTFAPHMSEDHKYYRRYNFESVAMEDYEVKDAMRRSSSPDLFIDIRWTDVEASDDGAVALCLVFIGNRTSEPALYSSVSLWVDEAVKVVEHAEWKKDRGAYTDAGQQYPIQLFHRNLVVPHHQPIFKEKEWNIAAMGFVFERAKVYKLGWRVEAPGSIAEKWGSFHLEGRRVVWTQEP